MSWYDRDQEDARLSAIARYEILDSEPEEGFDDLVFLASTVCETPVALVSLVDRNRQWFKARIGLEACETPLGQSVCKFTLARRETLVIPDLTLDPRTRDNPLVTAGPRIRFYAGAPLWTPTGVAIGALCVIDDKPRPQGLDPIQLKGLAALARQVIQQLEGRAPAPPARAESGQGGDGARMDVARAQNAEEAGRIGTFEVDVASGMMSVSPQLCRLFGVAVAPVYPASVFEGLVIGEDAGARSAPETRASATAPLDVEYRIRRADDGAMRWIARRAEFRLDASGAAITMLGTVHDITDRRRAQAYQSALLAIGDRLRDMESTDEITRAAAELIGPALGASRASFGRIDTTAEHVDIEEGWNAPGVASIAGRHKFADYGDLIHELLRGDPLMIEDVATDPRTRGKVEALRAIDIGALVNIPLIDHGRTTGVLIAQDRGPRVWDSDTLAFLRNAAERVALAIAGIRADEQQKVLNAELSHRLKNTLAMVQAIANHALRSVPDREPVEAFQKRLLALSSSHDILLQQNWSEARLLQLVQGAVNVLGAPERFDIAGPDIPFGPRAALSAALLLHELGVNATKYGALSVPGGRVAIRWRIDATASEPELVMVWSETGGPPAKEPDRKGFGSRLIRMGLTGTGGVELSYRKSGFSADMRAPLAHLRQS